MLLGAFGGFDVFLIQERKDRLGFYRRVVGKKGETVFICCVLEGRFLSLSLSSRYVSGHELETNFLNNHLLRYLCVAL